MQTLRMKVDKDDNPDLLCEGAEMLEGLLIVEEYAYESDFHVSDRGFKAGRVADSTSTKLRFWNR